MLSRRLLVREEFLLHVGGDFQLRFLSPPTVGLFADGGDHAVVVPGFLDEVAGAAPHGFDGQVHAAPRGHHDHRRMAALRFQAGEQVETFFSGGGVAGVVEVRQDEIERLRARGLQQRPRRIHGARLVPVSLQKQAHGLQHIGLVVAYQNPAFDRFHQALPIQ